MHMTCHFQLPANSGMEQQDTVPYDIEAVAALGLDMGCKDFMKSPVAAAQEAQKLQLIRAFPLQMSNVSVVDAAREPPSTGPPPEALTNGAAAAAAAEEEATLCDTLLESPEMEALATASTGHIQAFSRPNDGKHPTKTLEDQDQLQPAADVPRAKEEMKDATKIPPSYPQGREEMKEDAPEVPPAHAEGGEEMKEDAPEVPPAHPEGQEEMRDAAEIHPPIPLEAEGQEEMREDAAKVHPARPEGHEEMKEGAASHPVQRDAKDTGEGDTVRSKRPSILDTLTPISPDEQSKLAAAHGDDPGEDDEEDEDGCPKKVCRRNKGRGRGTLHRSAEGRPPQQLALPRAPSARPQHPWMIPCQARCQQSHAEPL